MRERFRNFLENYKKQIEIAQNIFNFSLLIVAIGGISIIIYSSVMHKDEVEAVSKEEIFSQNDEIQERFYIDLVGQIVSPGVYEIFRGDIILDVVDRAGGFTQEADLYYVQRCINLSEKVKDQQKIYVPAKDEVFSCNDSLSGQSSSEDNTGSQSLSPANQISLNTSTIQELDSLPGIGPATAQKIIDARPFSSIDEIKNVDGIGDATFEKLKDSIVL